MKKYLLANTKNAYKANLHAHTNISDGKLSPAELKELYKSNGYSVVAYTDHDVFIPHSELTDDEFVALSALEVQFNGSNRYPGVAGEKKCHICLIAKSPDTVEQPCWREDYAYIGNCAKHRERVQFCKESYGFEREYTPECINKLVSIAKGKGFFATLNHPAWSLEGYEQYINYTEFDALEIFNTACEMLGFTTASPAIYDDMLRSGKKVFAVAADDVHNGVDDTFGGFVMIKADELKYGAITEALAKGDFYASTGPLFHEIYIEDGKLYLRTSDVVWVGLTTDRRKSKCVRSTNGEVLNEAVIPLDFDCQYFRITVRDAQGNFAYTNVFFTEEL
jgi:hypothetical protein